MKLFIALLSVCGCVSDAVAQFNTVTGSKSLYRIETVAAQNNSASAVVATDADVGNPHAKAGVGDSLNKDEWLRRWLSVSYPLTEIRISSRFGTRIDPFTHKKSRHNGLDLKARYAEVYSMMGGEVVRVASDKRSGNYVSVRYGEYTVSYCHLSRVLVKPGTTVMPGEVIAISGNTGRSTGPHLHITVRHGRRYIDPAILLDFIRNTRQELKNQLLGKK